MVAASPFESQVWMSFTSKCEQSESKRKAARIIIVIIIFIVFIVVSLTISFRLSGFASFPGFVPSVALVSSSFLLMVGFGFGLLSFPYILCIISVPPPPSRAWLSTAAR
jgi:glucose-6-phosphate-specific signal transduction histidine kinase